MLKYLNIKNYALIEDIEIDLEEGLTIITGQTGAGKSIILGAISLLTGSRADRALLRNQSKKCIIEASFDVSRLNLKSLFEEFNLDYDDLTIIRREFSQDGKSRVFINDSPAVLLHLRELMNRMLDVHSQHENLELNNKIYQLRAIDGFAGNKNLLLEYKQAYGEYRSKSTELETLKEKSLKLRQNTDLFAHQLNELVEASLEHGEQESLEEELSQLNNAEEIKQSFLSIENLLNENEANPLTSLNQLNSLIKKIRGHFKDLAEIGDRLENLIIELDDIRREVERISERFSYDPERLQVAQDRLSMIYQLQHKYRLNTVGELITKREELRSELEGIENLDEDLENCQREYDEAREKCQTLSNRLSDSRYSVLTGMEEGIMEHLRSLGMVNSQVKIELIEKTEFGEDGNNEAEFLFSANKGHVPRPIGKVVSGGELSRLMLSIKALLTEKSELPTIIFDEIDTGISGVIAEKMGKIIRKMCDSTQVIAITHLPQIAAMGHRHLEVYKDEEGASTTTNIRELKGEERVIEIARLLSGEEISREALDNAKVLLAASG